LCPRPHQPDRQRNDRGRNGTRGTQLHVAIVGGNRCGSNLCHGHAIYPRIGHPDDL